MTLDQVAIGSSAVVTQVGGEGALRLRLLDMGILPNTVIKVQKAAPLGDPIEIHLRGYELTLRREDAAWIEVSPHSPNSGCADCSGCRGKRRGRHAARTGR